MGLFFGKSAAAAKADKEKESIKQRALTKRQKEENEQREKESLRRFELEQQRLKSEREKEIEKERIDKEYFATLPVEVQLKILEDKKEKQRLEKIEKDKKERRERLIERGRIDDVEFEDDMEELMEFEKQFAELEEDIFKTEKNNFLIELTEQQTKLIRRGLSISISSPSSLSNLKSLTSAVNFNGNLTFTNEFIYFQITINKISSIDNISFIVGLNDILDIKIESKMFSTSNTLKIKSTNKEFLNHFQPLNGNSIDFSIKKNEVSNAKQIIEHFLNL